MIVPVHIVCGMLYGLFLPPPRLPHVLQGPHCRFAITADVVSSSASAGTAEFREAPVGESLVPARSVLGRLSGAVLQPYDWHAAQGAGAWPQHIPP